MAPAYNRGDIVFGFRGTHQRPNFGDIVLFQISDGNPPAIGRVAGVPGDHIVVDGGHLYRNEMEVPFFSGSGPTYQLQVAGAGVLIGNHYIFEGLWPTADRWAAPDRIPDDCYLVLADDSDANDSHRWGFFPGSSDGPCASKQYPQARIVTRVINSWPTGRQRDG